MGLTSSLVLIEQEGVIAVPGSITMSPARAGSMPTMRCLTWMSWLDREQDGQARGGGGAGARLPGWP
jgi:hypothetical protein